VAGKPIVLLGDTRSHTFIERMTKEGFGVMFVDRLPKIHYPGMPWAWDNGAFPAWRHEREVDWAAWHVNTLRIRGLSIHPPLFAVVPDLPTRGLSSLKFSRQMAYLVPEEFPKALALQDGMNFQAVKAELDLYDWLFIGGSDGFKVQAADWVRFARDNGKKIHYARASTLEKLEWAMHLEVDSLDSSFPVMDERKVPSVRRLLCPRTSKPCPVPEVSAKWRAD
jgi:hypothetical protein